MSYTHPRLLLLVLCVMGLFVADVLVGSVVVPLGDTLQILAGKAHENKAWMGIIWQIRLPKALTGVLAGAALSVAGLQLQAYFRNPLAGPSVLGITAGASLGVAVVMLGFGSSATVYAIRQLGIAGSWLIVAASFAGALAVFMIILAVSVRVRDQAVLLIVGLMVGNITLSVVSIWQYFSQPEQLQDYLMWTFGSLGGVSGSQLGVLAGAVAVGLLLAGWSAKPLNALLLGESYAQSMGVNIRQARLLIISGTCLLAGTVTGFCGPIGFIGIAVPHLVRAWFATANHRWLVPGCALTGMVVMLGCDLLAQLPGSSATLPINAITALIGSPVVIWVIMRKKT